MQSKTLRMPFDMIFDETCHKEIGMVIAGMHAVHRRGAGLGERGGEGLRLQLVEELVVRALVDQHVALPAARAEEMASIVLLPLLAVIAEIGAKLLLAPFALDGVRDRREGRDRAVEI